MNHVQLPASVRLGQGIGGLPVLRVDGPEGWAEIHLSGAHVTAWGPTGRPSVLWLSPLSRFGAGAAIRGGIPLCFPWFGLLEGVPDAPQHGLGRTALWVLEEVREVGREVVVRMTMADDAGTRASAWPHPFAARCTVTVGAQLTVELEFTHRGTEPVRLEAALHTYLTVPDVTAVEVTGLEGVAYIDKTAQGALVPGVDEPLRIDREVDRIYVDTVGPVSVRDERAGLDLLVEKAGSTETVVWNPWIDRARVMADIGDGGWQHYVCVETCAVRAGAVPLAEGETHAIRTTITAGPPVSLSVPTAGSAEETGMPR